MTPHRPRAALPVAFATAVLTAATWLGACTVDRSRSPVCGMALLVGPNLILQRLSDGRTLLTNAPRGLPGSLPVRITGPPAAGRAAARAAGAGVLGGVDVTVGLGIAGESWGRDATVFGVLLVDDSRAVVYG